jgi:hypothetical protein
MRSPGEQEGFRGDEGLLRTAEAEVDREGDQQPIKLHWMVRRIFSEARPLPPTPGLRPRYSDFRSSGLKVPPANVSTPCVPPGKHWGPFPLSGRWWCGEKTRKYCFAENGQGEILWLRFDRRDGQWVQIGIVE